MKKIIIFILIISVFILSGCQKNISEISNNSSIDMPANVSSNVDSGLDNSSSLTSSEPIQSTPSSDNNSSIVDNTSSDTTTESVETVTSSNEKPKIIRPEKITNVYAFNFENGGSEPIKETFYDQQNGNKLKYCLYLPANYSADKKYPVILFLHGAGEIGADNIKQLNNIRNMFDKNPDYVAQSILICPQTPEWWYLDREYGDRKGTLSSALNLLYKIEEQYSCDKNRIYVTGLSMGGYATWELLQNYGEIFAAGVPVCGFGTEMLAYTLVDIPIRIYHGTADPTVSFSNSQRMYDAIIAAGGTKVELFPLEGVGHDAWHYAYADSTMFDWMFAQDKSKQTPSKIVPSLPFKILDSNGNIVISNEDVYDVDYSIVGSAKTGDVDIELLLTENGKEKLEKAYTASGGKEFTVYCRLQKMYSFTATNPPVDNKFVISGIFKIDNYLSYYHMLREACY